MKLRFERERDIYSPIAVYIHRMLVPLTSN